MRKYFLLSAVALMISSSANATADYAEVTAKATIAVANTFTCSELNFGTLFMKHNNAESYVRLLPNGPSMDLDVDVISAEGISPATCSLDSVISGRVMLPDSIQLTGVNTSEKLTVDDFDYATSGGESDDDYNKLHIGAALHIPSEVTADEYIGSFTVSVMY